MKTFKIVNEDEAGRLIDFQGMEFRNYNDQTVGATNVDASIEINDELYIFFETKYEGKEVPYGQRLYMERITDRLAKTGVIAVAAVVENVVDPVSGHIMLAQCKLREYKFGGKNWVTAKNQVTALEFRDYCIKIADYDLWRKMCCDRKGEQFF